MIRSALVIWASAIALFGSAFQLYAAESEIFTGTAARSGTYKRPLLQIDGKRYELKPSDKADASAAEMLAKSSQGDLGHSSWLRSEDIAFIYRAYATHDNPLAITSPGPCGPGTPALDEGANVPITVDASKFPNCKTLEFYDGAKRLGTVTAAPARFTATNLTPGYHVFSVIGTDAKGTLRTSDPRMVVVRSPPTDVAPAQQ